MSVREKEKKPSAMKQVHNKVNAGIMDAVAYGGMCEAADPEDEEYQIGMEDGGLEPYAHTLKEGKEQLSEYQKYIKSFIQFLRSQHISIDPLPEIELNDEEQDGLFIKTGYYSPDERKIVAFTNARHIKDVLRTIAHEFVHHMQNLQNPDKDWGSNGDLEQDRKLRGIEGEAYLLGNILFREWTEYAGKNEKNLNESRITESPDQVDELGLVFHSEDAVPFMRLNYDGKFYVGNPGENHIKMISKITERDYDELYDEIESINFGYYVDLESTGRYWQKKNVISFWETPIQKRAKLLNVIGRLANSVEVNFRTLVIDWWDGENERLIPYRWLNNGTFEMLYPRGIKSVVPYMQPKYSDIDEDTMFKVVTESDGWKYLVLDFSGDIVPLERRVGVGAINESKMDEYWNGDGEEMIFNYPKTVPEKLYHVSPKNNRQQIMRLGLIPSVGNEYYDWWSYDGPNGEYDDLSDLPELVFLSTDPKTWLHRIDPNTMLGEGGDNYDIYEVDTRKLDREDISYDPTPHLAKENCYCYGQVIPPSALRLVDPSEYSETETLNEITDEIVEPDDVDLSSFNIKKHLNPKFWDDGHLDTRIRLRLLDIADDFFDSLGVDWVEPEDVIITGSIANYNWNSEHSDIDLHILVDYEDVDERVDFVREYFTLKKNEWNDKHKGLRIFGFPVEVYVQDANEPHASSGVYSIDRDEWITEPDREKLRSGKVDKRHVREMVSTYMNKIDCLIDIYKRHKDDVHELENVAKDAAEMMDEIKKLRKDDLAKYNREMCDGNIIFKALRRSDYIGKLIKLKNLTYDKINSL